MNDLDTLRQALHATPDPHAHFRDDLDVAGIVRQGKRLRARRRLVTVGGVACVAAVAFGALTGVGHAAGPSVPAVDTGRSSPARVPGRATSPSSRPPRAQVPVPSASPSATANSASSPTPSPSATYPTAFSSVSPVPTSSSPVPTSSGTVVTSAAGSTSEASTGPHG